MSQAIVLASAGPGGLVANVAGLLNDPYFYEAFSDTLLLAAVIIPLQVLLALGLALLINVRFPGHNILLYILVLPLTISDVAAGLIWYSMLAPYGFFNRLLMGIGLIRRPIYFFGYQFRQMEFLAIVITEVWRATAIVFVIILAGLQMINKEYVEAAEVFGANLIQRLRHIILPLLKPSLQAALIIRTLFAFQVFGQVWILAGRDIPVLAGEAYYQQVEIKNYSAAALYSLIIAGLSVAVGLLYIKLLKPQYAGGGG